MIPDMPRPKLPHLNRHVTQHETVVWYVRKGHGPRIRLRAPYGSDEFHAEYRAAIEGRSTRTGARSPHSLAWALDRYRASSAWAALSAATRRQRENIYKQIVKTAGDEPLASIGATHIVAGRERRSAKPHAANNYLKAMRGFFGWAADPKGGALMPVDPTKGVLLLEGPNDKDGHHTWTEEEVARFEAHWPLGARERLAFDQLLYTGLRRGDAVRLGRPHVKDGVIAIATEKSRFKDWVYLPILPPLARSIEKAPAGELTFIAGERGRPMTKESFGNWFREACAKAKCPGSAHGLRKAGATRAAEAGASERQLMALFGWTTGKMAAHYTRAADRKRLAKDAAALLLPHPATDVGQTAKKHKISGT